MTRREESRRVSWGWISAVFGLVFGASLVVIGVAGTDIPFHDEWDVNGRWLLPSLVDGTLRLSELFRFHNEHRIFWTHLQSVGVFLFNGQWDPLVDLVVNAVWRSAIAAGLMAWGGIGRSRVGLTVVAVALIAAFVPVNAWHAALWGFESQVLFALGFGLGSIVLLAPAHRSTAQKLLGLALGLGGLFAMAPAALAGAALLAVATVRAIESRSFSPRECWPALLLFGASIVARAGGASVDDLHPSSVSQGLEALGRALAWPHSGQPWAAVMMNLPLVFLVLTRIRNRRAPALGEDVITAMAFWSAGVACAIAWARGGSDELAFGVPSRYADFMVLLPLANAWAVVTLVASYQTQFGRRAATGAVLWTAFLLIGWTGLSVENLRRVILPRTRDTAAPVRLAREFQVTENPSVLLGQPRLLVPHPDPAVVAAVLRGPRLKGKLPPSLQPEHPAGPLSRAVRRGLQRDQ